jgi:hypothetical protein
MGGDSQQAISLYQTLFDLQMSLVESYHLSPFEIRQSRFSEFCILLDRMHDKTEREKLNKHKGRIRRKASDNWF